MFPANYKNCLFCLAYPTGSGTAIGLLLLIVLSVILRLPSIAYPLLDWDEGMYMTVAQDIVRGYLPYAQHWVNKPPLAFVPYALSNALFGNSIIAMHLFGAVYVGIVAGIIYLSGRQFLSPAASGFAAAIFIALLGDAVLTEHIALLPLAWVVFQVCRDKPSAWQLGIAISICALIRINLLLLLPAGIWFYYRSRNDGVTSLRELIKATMLVTFFAAIPLVFVFALYWQSGQLHMLYLVNVVFSAMFFENNHLTLSRAISTNYLISIRNILILPAFFYTAWLWQKKDDSCNRRLGILMLFSIVIWLSILITGDKYDHYDIQLIPFVVLPFAQLARQCIRRATPAPWLWTLCCLCTGAYALYDYEVAGMVKSIVKTGRLPGSDSHYYEIADYINRHKKDGDLVLSLQNPVINFMTGSPPPAAPTSPNDYYHDNRLKLVYGDAYTLDDFARDIFQKKPRFVIILPGIRQFSQMMPYIKKHYVIRIENPKYQIYEYDADQQ